ncbi:uncharacterized protein B4U80_11396 [Leptotrombidium deliense]|uniref:Uncharacterized protein n=1 Tax=Leptotrombidium deliense TaxID=299467 RepID=A0A443SK17_9ACAR|nr:uncharacterized protein B4U80_11396 [Leptotrombidium deliense]
MSIALKLMVTFLIVAVFVVSIQGYNLQDANGEDEYYATALANLLKQRQRIENGQEAAMAGAADKRGCIRRGGGCEGRPNDCCEGNSCRCNLFGSNCRCQRMGLFQKLI